jgi:uncharacterized membrane protein YecN with MAPEG domain
MYIWFTLFAGLNGLLLTLLAMNVSRCRLKYQVGNGDGDIRELRHAIRAHGNAVEHCLLFALLILALCIQGNAPARTGFLVIAFTAIRVLHALSMLRARFKLRQLTAGGTYALELMASLLVLVQALSR